MVTHDWPRNIAHHGDLNKLLRWKPFLEKDIKTQSLGWLSCLISPG
jgi:lariat debranching enzyme